MIECVCELATRKAVVVGGNQTWRELKDVRAVMMATCVRCNHQWATSDRMEYRCPSCEFRKVEKYVEFLICSLHGARGPQTVKMGEILDGLRLVPREPRNLAYYTNLLEQKEPITHSRWNDGEWLTVLGYYNFSNSNGCTFEKPLSEGLRHVLRLNRPYDHALLTHALRRYGFFLRDFLEEENIKIKWVKGDVFLNSMLAGRMYPLIRAIREYRVLYVGPAHCRNLHGDDWFDLVDFIEPPPLNAHRVKEKIVTQVMASIDEHNVEFIGWSSGLASKIFIDEVFAKTNGEVSQIDFGSSFDGFYKPLPHIQQHNPKGSRSYIRKGDHDWNTLYKQNTEGK